MEHGINRIHERALRLIYPYQNQPTFKEVLEKNKTVSIRERNSETFANEIYKAKHWISPNKSLQVNSLFEFINKS